MQATTAKKYTFNFSGPERQVFRPREQGTVSQWAERHRVVIQGPSPGKWSNDFIPYLAEPMDTWQLPWVRKVILCWAPQSGKTSVALNCLLWAIDQDPGPAMYIMPDEKVAKRISRRQLLPTLRATPRNRALLSPRADDTSTLEVRFVNGMDLMLAWATSAAAMASESIRYLFLDEPAKYPDFSGKEADPFSLAEVRTTAYPYTSKIFYYSTPNLEDDAFDVIFKGEPDQVRRLHALCPFCGHLQQMNFDSIHWPKTVRDPRLVLRKRLARYSCVNCGMDWDDSTRDQAVAAGRWVPDQEMERPRCVGFGPLPSWYSPLVSLSKPAANFLKGLKDPAKMMAFVTQDKAEPWKEVLESKQENEVLKLKSALPPGIVPNWAVALTCGIDVQKVGFWFVVRAWGPELDSHLVQYGYLSSFADVELLLFETRFPKVDGSDALAIWRAGMDTGGGKIDEGDWSRTEEIYQWLRRQVHRHIVFGTKGASKPQLKRVRPTVIDRMTRGNRPIPGGLELRIIDTAQFKTLIHWRMGRREGESQRFSLHAETGIDYARQLLAEEKRKSRRGKVEWIRIRRDNHLLDCEVLAAACADGEWTPSLVFLARQLKEAGKGAPAPQQQTDTRTRPAMAAINQRRLPSWFQNR